VLALHNNYHGDTLGAMDCAAPSGFNGRLQSPWCVSLQQGTNYDAGFDLG
jgi:adenosylmethionine-8-amino-7-oxononanoate aminotransferase